MSKKNFLPVTINDERYVELSLIENGSVVKGEISNDLYQSTT